MPKKLIIANWKELPETPGQAEEILEYLSEELSTDPQIGETVNIVLCPPIKHREQVIAALNKEPLSEMAELGAQDIDLIDNGELNSLGVEYVIIGHSSRRKFESDEIINKKLQLALARELVPVVCIGENSRDGNYEQFLKDQFTSTFDGISQEQIGKCFIAYEPVWAISTNPSAKPDSPNETRKALAILRPLAPNSLLLYGGSVNQSNAREFLSMPEISGVLVGGASVRKEEFVEILKQI